MEKSEDYIIQVSNSAGKSWGTYHWAPGNYTLERATAIKKRISSTFEVVRIMKQTITLEEV
mgnify:CR=1 FL=1